MSGSSFAARKITIGLPVIASLVLSLVAGGLQTISEVLLTRHPQTQGIIVVFIGFLVSIGVNPATGRVFATLLHLPPWLFTLLTALTTAAAGISQMAGLPHGWHIGIVDALTIFAALGLGIMPAEPPQPLFASAAPPGNNPPPTALAAPAQS